MNVHVILNNNNIHMYKSINLLKSIMMGTISKELLYDNINSYESKYYIHILNWYDIVNLNSNLKIYEHNQLM